MYWYSNSTPPSQLFRRCSTLARLTSRPSVPAPALPFSSLHRHHTPGHRIASHRISPATSSTHRPSTSHDDPCSRSHPLCGQRRAYFFPILPSHAPSSLADLCGSRSLISLPSNLVHLSAQATGCCCSLLKQVCCSYVNLSLCFGKIAAAPLASSSWPQLELLTEIPALFGIQQPPHSLLLVATLQPSLVRVYLVYAAAFPLIWLLSFAFRAPCLDFLPAPARKTSIRTHTAASEVSSILESRIGNASAESALEETGKVLTIGDGIARWVDFSSPQEILAPKFGPMTNLPLTWHPSPSIGYSIMQCLRSTQCPRYAKRVSYR